MTDRIRTTADDALALGEKLGDLALEGHKAWSKHVQSGLETGRVALEIARDTNLAAARAFVDAALPRPAEPAKQA